MPKILVVDDERNVLRAFEDILTARGHEVVCVRGAEEAMRRLKDADVDLVILDICLPGMNGLDALAQIRQLQPTLPVIVMTGQGTTDTAIEATKRGAFDYQLEALRAGGNAADHRQGAGSGPADERPPRPESGDERAAVRRDRRTQPADAATLQGDRAGGPDRRDRAHPRGIGHGKGTGGPGNLSAQPAESKCRWWSSTARPFPRRSWKANSSATSPAHSPAPLTRRIGKFEQAHGGTIFLDEIGDIPLMVQAKILRALQDGTFQRLGGNETLQSDVRVLCATNRDLEAGDRRGGLPRGSLSPPQRGHFAASAAAGKAGRHSSSRRLFLEPLCPRGRHRKTAPGPERAGCPGELFLARQRAGVGAPDSAADDLHRRLHDPGPRPALGLESRPPSAGRRSRSFQRRAMARSDPSASGLLCRRPCLRGIAGEDRKTSYRRGITAVARQPDACRPAVGTAAADAARQDAEIWDARI